MRKVLLGLATLSILVCVPVVSLGEVPADDGIFQVPEFISAQGLEPTTMGMILEDEEGRVFWDLFPMEANVGERTEGTEDYWQLYDAIMDLRFVETDVEIEDLPEYTLEISLDGDRDESVMLSFYGELNVVDLTMRVEGAAVYSQRYLSVDRTLLNGVYADMQRFKASF